MSEASGQPAASTAPMILVVDDDRGLLRLIERALQREGFAAATAASGREAEIWLTDHQADLMLLDLKLQDVDGKELIRRLGLVRPNLPFVIITGQGDERVAVEMMKSGARDYLVKDVDFLQFVPEVVKHVLEQIETERRLEAAEERVNLVERVVERGFSAVLIASADLPDPKILYINPTFAQLTGCRAEEAVGKPLSVLRGLTAIQERLRHGIPERERFLEEASSYQTADGERWGEWRVGPVKDRNGRITHWLIIFRDITERKRLEKEILEISDREQRRIGQDLHDGLCQQLAGIELMSQVLAQKLGGKSKPDAQVAAQIAGHVRDAISQTRLLARGMSPVTLDSEGLMSALQELAANTEKIFGVACAFHCPRPVLVEDHAAATHLFRIVQEAVSNAIRHGKAAGLEIHLLREDGRLTVAVADRGTGFPAALPKERGMGLRIMQSRAAMIGGTLSFENQPGGGAKVICSVALKPALKQNASRRARKKENDQREKTDSDR